MALLTAVLVLPAVTGCSQGERRAEALAIRDSIPRGAGQAITGTLALELGTVTIHGDRQVQLRTGTLAFVAFAAEPKRRRSALQAKPGGPPVYLTAGRSVYARRTTHAVTERRPWARLDLKRVDQVDKPSLVQLVPLMGPADVSVLDPQLLLDLLSGALTGSVKAGAADADGSREYRFNVSVDKANRTLELSDDARKDREKLLRSLAITSDVHPATARLRKDGSLAAFVVTFVVRPDKQASIPIVATLTVQAGSVPDGLAVPDRATTVRVSTLGDIRAALALRLGSR